MSCSFANDGIYEYVQTLMTCYDRSPQHILSTCMSLQGVETSYGLTHVDKGKPSHRGSTKEVECRELVTIAGLRNPPKGPGFQVDELFF